MFEKLSTPAEAFNHKLGATLKMEQTVLKILDSAIKEAQDERVRELLERHREETVGHVRNVEAAFEAFGWDVDDSSCPAIDGLQAEAKATAKKADESVVDSLLLQGTVEVEHHEIGVYENLLINAEGMGREDVIQLLRSNLDGEQHALEKARRLEAEIAAATPVKHV